MKNIKASIRKIFHELEQSGNWQSFIDILAEDIVWTVTGSSPISGIYSGKAAWRKQVLEPLFQLLTGPMQCRLTEVIFENEKSRCHLGRQMKKAVVIWEGKGRALSGVPYQQEYCWILEFNATGKVVQLKGFYDTFLVTSLFMLATKMA